MKLISVLLLSLFLQTGKPIWYTDFEKAKSEAKTSGRRVLVNFSGSDWCIPCIRMHKVIFEAPAFDSLASKELVLVQADFPRMKKHQLPKDQQKHNEQLADKYNPQGKFPFTVLLDAEGRVIKSWDGMPEGLQKFNGEINEALHASH